MQMLTTHRGSHKDAGIAGVESSFDICIAGALFEDAGALPGDGEALLPHAPHGHEYIDPWVDRCLFYYIDPWVDRCLFYILYYIVV